MVARRNIKRTAGRILKQSTTSVTGDPWDVIGYEVQMYFGMRAILASPALFAGQLIKNAIVESAVLHMRILCEVFTSTCPGENPKRDDIQFGHLFADWRTNPSRYTALQSLSAELQKTYGLKPVKLGQPRWELNKMLVHPTLNRGTTYNYDQAMTVIHPHVVAIVEELERLKGQGFRFYRG